jgi:hypothetical protein
MNMVNVRICRLGRFNHKINWGKIEKWESRFFKVSGGAVALKIGRAGQPISRPLPKSLLLKKWSKTQLAL